MIEYRYEMHLHTSNVSSCGKVCASEAVRLYADAGYTGIVITDHYYEGYFNGLTGLNWEDKLGRFLEGYESAVATGKKLGLVVLLGLELRFEENSNDYLVYGVTQDFLLAYPELFRLGLAAFRNLTKDQGIMIYQAHPFRMGMKRAAPTELDGVEVFNGNLRHNSRNHSAVRFAQKHALQAISGSDFHQVGDQGRGGIVLPQKITTTQELVEFLKTSNQIKLV